MNQPSVHVIIINWNEEGYTIACIESLLKVKYDNLKIILVDNGSEYQNFKKLKKRYNSKIKIIRLENNEGFTGGNNVGIQYSLKQKPKYILLLNNDTEVESDFLTKIIEIIDKDNKIGVIGPKINYLENKNLIWCVGGKFNLYTGNNELLWNKHKDNYTNKKIIDVDYVSGCAMLVRAEIFRKIGLLDNNYFIYNEESDFCLRVKRELNLRRVCRLDSKIYHKVSLTNTKLSGFSEYYLTRNRLYFIKKHNPYKKYILSLAYFFIVEVPKYTIFYPLVYKNIKILKFFYRGITDYFKNNMGKTNLFK